MLESSIVWNIILCRVKLSKRIISNNYQNSIDNVSFLLQPPNHYLQYALEHRHDTKNIVVPVKEQNFDMTQDFEHWFQGSKFQVVLEFQLLIGTLKVRKVESCQSFDFWLKQYYFGILLRFPSMVSGANWRWKKEKEIKKKKKIK